jgi:hypothetical protein
VPRERAPECATSAVDESIRKLEGQRDLFAAESSALETSLGYLKALGGGDDQAVVKALASHARYLRGEVARAMATKYTPDLRFRPDESYDAGARIDAILRRPMIARDLEPETRLPKLSDYDETDDED